MLARSWDRNSLCPFVHTSVTRVLCDKTKNILPIDIQWQGYHSSFLIPTKVGGRCSHPPETCAYSAPTAFEKCYLRPISAYNVWTLRASEKSLVIANRKSTTRFPASYRWSAYVTPNSPKGGSQSEFVVFVNKIQVQSNKVCYKVSLCENFQRQSCSTTIPLSKGV